MPEWLAPDRSRSRAVLMGTSEYRELPSIPAAANSLDRMHRLLTGPLCAWPPGQVTVLPNELAPGDLADRLVELYTAATDVALFYYVGHGQIDDDDKLCLGLVGTRVQAERRATTSLTFDAVRAALRKSRAAVKIVILDCCFAGQAVHGPHTLAGHAVDVPALTGGTGAYTLAATGDYTTAWFEDDGDTPTPQTYFTKYLVELVELGIPGEPTELTLDPIYRRLREDLPAAGKPVPTRSSRDFADTFVFARNVAPQQRPKRFVDAEDGEPPQPAVDEPPKPDPASHAPVDRQASQEGGTTISNPGVATTRPAYSIAPESASPAVADKLDSVDTAGFVAGRPAGFWIRVGAFLIDYLILTVIPISISSVVAVRGGTPDIGTVMVFDLFLFVTWVAYLSYMWSSRGQTVGMMLTRLKVVRANGAPLTLGWAIARALALAISLAMFGVGILMVAFTEQSKASTTSCAAHWFSTRTRLAARAAAGPRHQ